MGQDDSPMGVSIEGIEKAMEDAGRMAFAYYESLVQGGFAPENAFVMVRDYMQIWWTKLLIPKEG